MNGCIGEINKTKYLVLVPFSKSKEKFEELRTKNQVGQQRKTYI